MHIIYDQNDHLLIIVHALHWHLTDKLPGTHSGIMLSDVAGEGLIANAYNPINTTLLRWFQIRRKSSNRASSRLWVVMKLTIYLCLRYTQVVGRSYIFIRREQGLIPGYENIGRWALWKLSSIGVEWRVASCESNEWWSIVKRRYRQIGSCGASLSGVGDIGRVWSQATWEVCRAHSRWWMWGGSPTYCPASTTS